MDHNLEQAKKKTDECKGALTYEMDTYTLSRFRLSTAGLVGRFLANRRAFHRKQMRQIVNDYFNKDDNDGPTVSYSQQLPNRSLPRTLAEYRELALEKTVEFKEALFTELDMFFQSFSRGSATGRSAQFFANLESFRREQMLLLIDQFFNTEADDQPTMPPSTTVNQLGVTSNQGGASAQVVTSPASPSISPVTPSDQQQLVNSGEVHVKEKPIDKDSSTQPREIYNPNTIENIVILSITEQEQSEYEADSDCGSDDCIVDKGRVQANAVMFDESVAQIQTDAQQQTPVSTAVNSSNELVDNSVNSNFENLNESQAMDFNDDAVDDDDEQAASQANLGEAFVDPTTLPTTSNGRLSTRSKKKINYAEADEDSDDEYSTVNRNGKRTISRAGKLPTPVVPVAANDEEEDEEYDEEYEEEDDEKNDEEEVGVDAVRMSVIVHHLNCPESGCTEEFKDKAQLNGHLLSQHQIMEFRCKVKDCGLSFVSKSELTDHLELAHRKLKNWPCAQCEITSKSYEKLCNHFSRYHEEGEFHCSVDKCGFTGKNRYEVYNHQFKHKPRKFRCTFADCTASFKQKTNLTIHLRGHAQEKPFACEQCPKAFTIKGNLTTHQRIHSGMKPYRCTWPGCGHSASDRSCVNAHVRTRHFGLPVSKKKQAQRRIIDTRKAREFVEKIQAN